MIEKKLAELGFTIDTPPEPIGNYEAAVMSGNMLYISGQLPISNGQLIYKGRVGPDLSISDGYRAAELAAVNVLAQIKKKLGSFDRLVKIVRVDGHIKVRMILLSSQKFWMAHRIYSRKSWVKSQGMQERYSDIQDYRKMQPLNWSSSLKLDSVASAGRGSRISGVCSPNQD